MSSLIKKASLSPRLLKNYGVVYAAVRNHWNKDFKAAPYPITEEQRRLAAEKYGLHPNDYSVFADDGTGYGDYPKLPVVSGEARDPNYPWDFPEHKRNFNEVLHVDADMYGEDRYNANVRLRFPLWLQFAQLVGVLSSALALYWAFDKARCFPGLIPKQYPAKGKVHYTFDSK